MKARKKRLQLAQRAVHEGLGIRQLAVEVRRQVPKSARIGRHFRLPGDKTALLLQLQSLCERWQRYEDSYRLPRNQQAAAVWEEVSAEVEQAYETTRKAVGRLGQAIAEELSTTRR